MRKQLTKRGAFIIGQVTMRGGLGDKRTVDRVDAKHPGSVVEAATVVSACFMRS